MDLDAKQFTTSALAAVTGCEPFTFRTWRNRNGLFPEVAGNRNWKRFTVVDLCIVRAIVVMTAHGLAISNAINFTQYHLRLRFERLLTGETQSDVVGFFTGGVMTENRISYRGDDGSPQVAMTKDRPEPEFTFLFIENKAMMDEVLSDTKGIVTIIDLMTVVRQVMTALKSVEGADEK